jgi:hypothetical protein
MYYTFKMKLNLTIASAFVVVCVFVWIYMLIAFMDCMLLHKIELKSYIRTKLKLIWQ